MSLTLLPAPRQIKELGGAFALPVGGFIALDAPSPADLHFTARRLKAALSEYTGANYEIAGGRFNAPITLILSHSAVAQPEGYRLEVVTGGVIVTGHDPAGVFYGVCTLIQLLQTHGGELPRLEINDYPDYPARGVLLDISRDKVPTMDTLYALIDLLAGWKINQLQLYMEHTFAYRGHEEVWAKASPLTADEILALDAYCRQRYVDLVPNQNSFGHLHRWFEHARYRPLAETETGIVTPWGEQQKDPFSLSPAVPGALDLVADLFRQLLPNFTSKLFNVGCDETFDLGLGRSKTLVEQKGRGRVYLDFLLKIYELVKSHERTMQFWGDIIGHHPELVGKLPRDIIALEWGYEATHDYPEKAAMFERVGVPFYVCPGTSSWTTIAGRTDNAIGNIRNAAENGLKNGAIGLLNTDWGDWGHWQPLSVSYLGFAYGAALSWYCAGNTGIDLPAALDAFAFRDRARVMGKLVYDVGNVYQKPGVQVVNGSLLFWLYHFPLDVIRARFRPLADDRSNSVLHDDELLRDGLQQTVVALEAAAGQLRKARPESPDAEIVKREYEYAIRLLSHGALRGLLQVGAEVDKWQLHADLGELEPEHRAVWLLRNRPGGMEDSNARLRAAKKLYEE